MDNYMGKICPHCGAELKEGTKYCSKCGANLTETSEQSQEHNICNNCGAEISEGQAFCTRCGHKIGIYPTGEIRKAVEQLNNSIDNNKARENKKKKTVLIAVATVVVLIVGFFGIQSIQKNSLKEKLQSTEWWTFDEDTELFLNFSDDKIDYDGYFGILGRRDIATLEYEVISGNKIKVESIEVEVDFDDGNVTFKPSFINSDSLSIWFD